MSSGELDVEVHCPTFEDLARNAEAGFVRKALARYLVPHNYERSIRLHERLGTPLVSRVVMGTLGRFKRPFKPSNYRIGVRGGRLEGAADFAFGGSVFNEAVHTIFAINAGATAVCDVVTHQPEFAGFQAPLVLGNLALVALQRYNRARMIRFVDRRLQRGEVFHSWYQNWTGIDARALENYREEQRAGAPNYEEGLDAYLPEQG